VSLDADDRVVEFVEKPEDPSSTLAAGLRATPTTS
jgi:dTDP-glucose pyrophosphorylase